MSTDKKFAWTFRLSRHQGGIDIEKVILLKETPQFVKVRYPEGEAGAGHEFKYKKISRDPNHWHYWFTDFDEFKKELAKAVQGRNRHLKKTMEENSNLINKVHTL